MQGREFLLDNILGERGFSVADLTRMTKLGRSSLDAIRRNGGGRRENLDTIASALGIEYKDLYGELSVPQTEKTGKLPESRAYDLSELVKYAEEYRSNGNEHLANALISVANSVGKDVNAILNHADDLYERGETESALREYTLAFSSFKKRDLARILASLSNYMDVCTLLNDIRPIETLFFKAKGNNYECFEIFFEISIFFLKNKVDEDLIIEALKEISKANK